MLGLLARRTPDYVSPTMSQLKPTACIAGETTPTMRLQGKQNALESYTSTSLAPKVLFCPSIVTDCRIVAGQRLPRLCRASAAFPTPASLRPPLPPLLPLRTCDRLRYHTLAFCDAVRFPYALCMVNLLCYCMLVFSVAVCCDWPSVLPYATLRLTYCGMVWYGMVL